MRAEDVAKAKFMREHGAVHAEWDGADQLVKLVLGPAPVARPAEAKPTTGPKGLAASLMRQHEIQFAHSRVKPPVKLPGQAADDVPRAVRAKHGASHGSAKAVQKRAS